MTILRRTDVIIIPMSICNGSGSYGGSLMSGVLCAGAIDGGHDACIVRKGIFLLLCAVIFIICRVTLAEVCYATIIWLALFQVDWDAGVPIFRAFMQMPLKNINGLTKLLQKIMAYLSILIFSLQFYFSF